MRRLSFKPSGPLSLRSPDMLPAVPNPRGWAIAIQTDHDPSLDNRWTTIPDSFICGVLSGIAIKSRDQATGQPVADLQFLEAETADHAALVASIVPISSRLGMQRVRAQGHEIAMMARYALGENSAYLMVGVDGDYDHPPIRELGHAVLETVGLRVLQRVPQPTYETKLAANISFGREPSLSPKYTLPQLAQACTMPPASVQSAQLS